MGVCEIKRLRGTATPTMDAGGYVLRLGPPEPDRPDPGVVVLRYAPSTS